MSTPPVYQQARAETAAMLGYDLASLTAEQATRLDVAAALRLAVDDQSGKLARGETADVTKLLSASEALARLLPPLREPPPTNRVDPRQIMLDTYMGMRRRGEIADPMSTHEGRIAEVERLKAELAAKDAEIERLKGGAAPSEPGASTGAFAPVDGASAPAAAVADNVVKLHDNSGRGAPLPQPPKPAPPAPAAVDLSATRSNGAGGGSGFRTGPGSEPWRNFVKIDWQG
jgi:hypothetical protein